MTSEKSSSEDKHAVDFRHTHRLIAVLIAVGVVAVVGRFAFVPATFGQYGNYRGQAPLDARKRTPRHQGSAACADCHAAEATEREKGAHAGVNCEACHGPGLAHVDWHRANKASPGKPSGDAPKTARMPVNKGKAWCMVCHQKLQARPGTFPQVEAVEHLEQMGVKDSEIACTECHGAHRTLKLSVDRRQAKVHPVVHRCRDCHIGPIEKEVAEGRVKSPHRSIFDCRHCHKTQAELADDASHSDLRCTQCHRLIRDSPLSARVVRNGGPGFCLLCHAEAAFRGDDGPPSIPCSWGW